MEKEKKQRTLRQNNAVHKYCTEIADELNAAGIAMDVFVKNISADHTMETVKSLWRAFAKAKYGKTSTADLSSDEITKIYEEVNRHVSQFGIHVSFPSYEEQERLKHYENNGIQ